MNDQKQQLIERVKQATNVLVAVSKDPSVDQLAAAIGLTLLLNEVGKHATAVFSGNIPSTVEFLKPEQTLEKDTSSLRDFIIALDKSKADKLRYKVEDRVVKIFITPYRTSLSQKDLEFSEGDFNVDVVICLGVHNQSDLDQAITAHGRILHDAAVVSINNTAGDSVGNINWQEVSASSLCELVSDLTGAFDKEVLDKQMATALLTGIVAETDRFRNAKTTPETMTVSAKLMSAGADQQLISSKLEAPLTQALPAQQTPPEPPKPDNESAQSDNLSTQDAKPDGNNDGSLEIDHATSDANDQAALSQLQPPQSDRNSASEKQYQQIHIDEHGQIVSDANELPKTRGHELIMPDAPNQGDVNTPNQDGSRERTMQPPQFGSSLTANTEPEDELHDRITDPLSSSAQFSERPQLPKLDLPGPSDANLESPEAPALPNNPKNIVSRPDYTHETLNEIEQEVHSPHLEPNGAEAARSAVEDAINSSDTVSLDAIQALNAQPLGDQLHDRNQSELPQSNITGETAPLAGSPADQPLDMPLPPSMGGVQNLPPAPSQQPSPADDNDSTPPPPPVPPPFMPGQQ